jgi:hypothetical protein
VAGAVLTIYNVGAYSVLNGVAGAYAEWLPVIFVSSGPNTNDPAANHIMHHTMGTHDFTDQYEVCRQVTYESGAHLAPRQRADPDRSADQHRAARAQPQLPNVVPDAWVSRPGVSGDSRSWEDLRRGTGTWDR